MRQSQRRHRQCNIASETDIPTSTRLPTAAYLRNDYLTRYLGIGAPLGLTLLDSIIFLINYSCETSLDSWEFR